MKRFFVVIVSLILVVSCPALLMAAGEKAPVCEDDQVIFATGISSGTYSQMTKDLIKVAPELICENTQSSGGPMNVDFLLARKVDAGLVQDDVLDFVNRTDPMVKKKLRALATLHGSALHIIVKRTGITYKKNFYSGEQRFVFKSLRELRGQPVVGFASGFQTGFIINERLTLGMQVKNADSKDEAFKMLDSGQVVAIFAMGGKPINWVEKLDGNVYALATIDPTDIGLLGTPYYATKLSYRNLAVMGLNTIAARNAIMVWDYSGKRAQKLMEMRRVLKENLAEIKEARGTHPAWQDIENLDDTYWQRYEPTGVTAEKKVVKKRK